MSLTNRFTAPDTRCLEKREIPTIWNSTKFDVVARFREMISMVESVSSFEIVINNLEVILRLYLVAKMFEGK